MYAFNANIYKKTRMNITPLPEINELLRSGFLLRTHDCGSFWEIDDAEAKWEVSNSTEMCHKMTVGWDKHSIQGKEEECMIHIRDTYRSNIFIARKPQGIIDSR